MSTASTDAGLPGLAGAFTVPDGHFDELRDTQRQLRPAWAEFAAHTPQLSADQLTRAQARVDRQIHENGVTYNVYASVDGLPRPWTLDVLPVLVPGNEWAPLGQALTQRARLLNAIAADLYGARTLLQENRLPPSLVFEHAGF